MDNFDAVLDPLRALLQQFAALLPRLLGAVGVVLAGWLLAKVVRLATVKALRAINFHVLTARAGIDGFLQQGGTDKDTTDVIGSIVYVLVILAALLVASNGLGLTHVSDLLGRAVLFVPRLLVAVFVLVLGSYFARFAGNAVEQYCRGAAIGEGEVLGRLLQYGVMAFVILLAVDHLDIGGGLIQQTFLILLAGVVVALALAFGLGGRERAAALIERWFPRDRDVR
jgi:Conserved TM helix